MGRTWLGCHLKTMQSEELSGKLNSFQMGKLSVCTSDRVVYVSSSPELLADLHQNTSKYEALDSRCEF
jgi:hypothetical protein